MKPEHSAFIYSVLIAVSWVVFYAICAGLALFGYIAHTESQACMNTYNAYLADIHENYTVELKSFTPSDIPKNLSFVLEKMEK